MGRWGWRLFEGDQDLDIACELNNALGEEEPQRIKLSSMIHQSDMLAPPEARLYYQTEQYKPELEELIKEIREKLDSGLGNKLFDMYREKENESRGTYRVIIVGALMMRAGAKIRDKDLQDLRKLVPTIQCSEVYALPLFDDGFRGPGKRQFLAALDNYKPGVPRNFAEPSCFGCGKIKADVAKDLLKCGKCRGAWYCDTTCQKSHWPVHKPSCIPPGKAGMLNV